MIDNANVDIDGHVSSTLQVHIRSQEQKELFNPETFLKSQVIQKYQSLDHSNFEKNALIDIHKFTQKLMSMSHRTSAHQCARYVRIALESAGASFSSHPIAASDWGATLMQIGYKRIEPSFDQPKEGDIYIIKSTDRHRYGHIAGFTGSQWISDFRQASYDVYHDRNVTYQYYRL